MVVLSEKVDTTLTKGALRIAGTAIGGSLGVCDSWYLNPHKKEACNVQPLHVYPLDITFANNIALYGVEKPCLRAGFLLMMRTDLATNPYALCALVCMAAAILAPVTVTDYKYAAFLTMITFNSLVLCQYRSAF